MKMLRSCFLALIACTALAACGGQPSAQSAAARPSPADMSSPSSLPGLIATVPAPAPTSGQTHTCKVPVSVISDALSPGFGAVEFKPEGGKSPRDGYEDCYWASKGNDSDGLSVEVFTASLASSSVPPSEGIVQAKYSACDDPKSAVPGVLPLSFICGSSSLIFASYTGAMVGTHSLVFVKYFVETSSTYAPNRAESIETVKRLQAALIEYS